MVMAATIDAVSILNEAAIVLNDTSNGRWSLSELLQYLNDAQLKAVILEPKVNPVRTTVQLQPGITQVLPQDGILLLDVFWNMGSDGATQGQAITVTNIDVMRKRVPNWTTDTPSGIVNTYMYDDKDPIHYSVWPPQPNPAWWIEINYSGQPAAIPDYNIGTKITVDDYWRNALLNFVLHRAFAKDAAIPEMQSRRDKHLELFLHEITNAVEVGK
jgi:hypothetical protein